MTTLIANSQKEFPQTGEPSNPTSSRGQLYVAEFSAARPLPLPNTVSLDSVIAEFEADPEMAEQMQSARRDLSSSIYADEPESLSALRLCAGLSQRKLAERVGTSQPYIARIEGGQTDPGTDVITRIAAALGVDESKAFQAIRLQRNSRGLRNE